MKIESSVDQQPTLQSLIMIVRLAIYKGISLSFTIERRWRWLALGNDPFMAH